MLKTLMIAALLIPTASFAHGSEKDSHSAGMDRKNNSQGSLSCGICDSGYCCKEGVCTECTTATFKFSVSDDGVVELDDKKHNTFRCRPPLVMKILDHKVEGKTAIQCVPK